MPREIWNEGRVVGLSAYELYVKQHLAEDPDTPVATEREWLASSLGMGSSMILKFPNTRANRYDYDDEYIDIPLPQDSKLAAANSIVATFFDGSVSDNNLIDDYWVGRVDNYGTLIRNEFRGTREVVTETISMLDVLNENEREPIRESTIPIDENANPPGYIYSPDNIKYISLGSDVKYLIGDGYTVDPSTGIIYINENESLGFVETLTVINPNYYIYNIGTDDERVVTGDTLDLTNKYILLDVINGVTKPDDILRGNVIYFNTPMDGYTNNGLYTHGQATYVRVDCMSVEKVSYEDERYLDGDLGINDNVEAYTMNLTRENPGSPIGSWSETIRNQISDYLKIVDGIVVQPGRWSESENVPPASDFEVNLKQRPYIRFRVRGKITSHPYILLTGFTVRYVLCGTLGQDTATQTASPQDGDFLGPSIFPWCNKVLFTTPNQYVDLFERNYLNRKVDVPEDLENIIGILDDSSYTINNDTSIIDIGKETKEEDDDYAVTPVERYYNTYKIYDKYFYKHHSGASSNMGHWLKSKQNSRLEVNVADYASLGDGQGILMIYQKHDELPPALYGGFISSDGKHYVQPIDIVSPGSIKLFHGEGDFFGGTKLKNYEDSFQGTDAIEKKYEDSTFWSLDHRTIEDGGVGTDTTVPIANVENTSRVKGYISRSRTTDIENPRNDKYLTYNEIHTGRNSVASMPFGDTVSSTDRRGMHDNSYVMSTVNSPVLEEGDYSDPDFINWYDMIRALSGNRKIDLLGKSLRGLKNSLNDSRISFNTYKLNLLKYGSGSSFGSSWTGPGVNDYYVTHASNPTISWNNTSGENSYTHQPNNLLNSVKMDVYGYTQYYNDGSKQTIKAMTFNYMASITAVINDTSSSDVRHIKFNTRVGNKRVHISSTSGITFTDTYEDGSTNRSPNLSGAYIQMPQQTIGVNSWVQAVKLNDRTNVVTLLKMLRNILPRKFYANSIKAGTGEAFVLDEIDNNSIYCYIGDKDLPESSITNFSTCRIYYDSSTADVILYSTKMSGGVALELLRVEGFNGKPSSGTYRAYVNGGDTGSNQSCIIELTIFYDNSVKKYKADVTCIVPDLEVQTAALTFNGRCATYHPTAGTSYADLVCRLDISGIFSDIDEWWGLDLDSIENPEDGSDVSLNGSIGGYIQGTCDGDSYWMDLYDTFTSVGGLSVSRNGIASQEFKSSGTVTILGTTIHL